MSPNDTQIPQTSQLVEIGNITSVHGLKGSVVIASSGKGSALGYLSELLIGDRADAVTAYRVTESAWMPRGWKVTLEGVSSKEQGEKLIALKVWARRDELRDGEKNEFYVADLVGCRILEEGTERDLGVLTHVEFAVARSHDRWWAKGPDGEYSIPSHARFIRKVDPDGRVIWIADYEELKP